MEKDQDRRVLEKGKSGCANALLTLIGALTVSHVICRDTPRWPMTGPHADAGHQMHVTRHGPPVNPGVEGSKVVAVGKASSSGLQYPVPTMATTRGDQRRYREPCAA